MTGTKKAQAAKDKREAISNLVIALLERERHNAQLCRWNHDVEYSSGYLYIDGENVGRVDRSTREKAVSMYNRGYRPRYFSSGRGSGKWNIESPDGGYW